MKPPPGRRLLAAAMLLIVSGILLLLVGLANHVPGHRLASQPAPLHAGLPTEPLLPPAPTAATPSDSPRPTPPAYHPTVSSQPAQPGLYSLRMRLGVGAGVADVVPDLAQRLGFGWYVDWGAHASSFYSPEVQYVPMIRLVNGKPDPWGPALEDAVKAHPGALWLVGNEPDVKWQDNLAPDAYAQAYHEVYSRLKELDPACQVAIGGVSQPTPLRLRYLDLILQTYRSRFGETMPVDVWNVHNFILREERDSWGVDIPPGMADQQGQLREIADHDSLEIFRQQIVDFRRWLKDRGEQGKPLIISEYGILMPTDYGFPQERVQQFMLDTFEFLRTAADPALGHPQDGFRLVQRWCWFSLDDKVYPTGNLLQADGSRLSPLGEAFSAYAGSSR